MLRVTIGVLGFLLVGICSAQSDWIDLPLKENTYYPQEKTYKVEQYQIPVHSGEGLEFKLAMLEGESIVYHWDVDMDSPELLTAEFHGHTERVEDEPGTVMFYKIHTDGKESGTLISPFDGIHGWYLRNDSGDDVVVNLSVAGFFEEIGL